MRRPYDHTKAWPTGQHLLGPEFPNVGSAIGIWQISVTKQHNGRTLTGQNRLQKIPNLRVLVSPPHVLQGLAVIAGSR